MAAWNKKYFGLAILLLSSSVVLTACFDGDKNEQETPGEKTGETSSNIQIEEPEQDKVTLAAMEYAYEPLRYFSKMMAGNSYFYKATGENPSKTLIKQENMLNKLKKAFEKDGVTEKEHKLIEDVDSFIANYKDLIVLRNETYRETKGRLLMNDINKKTSYINARTALVDEYIQLREGLLLSLLSEVLVDQTPVLQEHAKQLASEIYLISGFATTDIYARIGDLSEIDTYNEENATKLLNELTTRMNDIKEMHSSSTNSYVLTELTNLEYTVSNELELSVSKKDTAAISKRYKEMQKASKENVQKLLKEANTKSKTLDNTDDEVYLGMLYLVLSGLYYPN